jgi:hypothetical protein
MGTLPDTPVKVLEHTNMEEMRQIASTVFGGRCRVSTDQFPLRDGTRIKAIPSFLPTLAKLDSMPVVIPYLGYKDQRRAVEILPDTPQEMLEMISAAHMGQPTKVIVKRCPIRDGDELILVPETDAQIAHEVKLQELREADKFIPKRPAEPTSSPPIAQVIQQQAPPRAQSRELTIPWEVTKPKTCDFNRQGTCVRGNAGQTNSYCIKNVRTG